MQRMYQSSAESLGKFGKHTPRILRRQLIHQLTEHYQHNDQFEHEVKNTEPKECSPSIQRFHGALLFVDISGFTALSLRLSVEELKNHINSYFTKMLDIVDKHGGDVIKFAGDALFITWQIAVENAPTNTRQSSDLKRYMAENGELKSASRLAVERAVACGLEITVVCGNQKVDLSPQLRPQTEVAVTSPSRPSSGMIRNLLPTVGSMFRSKAAVTTPESSAEDNVAYLNVHAGVSMGLMAGIDIGANDRWEFFLVGEPLSKVAIAEGQAALGEIVICPESHELIHPTPESSRAQQTAPGRRKSVAHLRLPRAENTEFFPSSPKYGGNNNNGSGMSSPKNFNPPTCSCKRLSNGYFQVSKKHQAAVTVAKKSRVKAKIEMSINMDETFVGTKLMTDIEEDLEFAFQTLKNSATKCMAQLQLTLSHDMVEPLKVEDAHQKLRSLYLTWINSCMADDLVRHAHNATRDDFRFKNTPRWNTLRSQMLIILMREKAHIATEALPALNSIIRNKMMSATGKAILFSVMLTSPHSVSHNNRDSSKAGNSLRATASRNIMDIQDSGVLAEIRTVTVLFIKIDVTNMELLVDSNERRSPRNMVAKNQNLSTSGSWFVGKTANETISDQILLDRMQACFVCLSEAFNKHGGQMRQFIVDDKGTVCIGTFGLRGSVSDDNAAAALDTARMIVDNLQGIGIESSIGVTVGRAYCGLVGSNKRHEYAVMGPSTNLSARLMCKAPPCGILCEIETRNRDRAHDFEKLSDIVAKGYKDPVGTFMPIFSVEVPTTDLSGKMNLKRSSVFMGAESFDNEEAIPIRGSMLRLGSEKIQRALVSVAHDNFYEVSDKSLRSNANGTRVFGRDQEIEQSLLFLFGSDTFEEAYLEGDRSKAVFSLNNLAKYVILCGTQGMGKGTIASTIAHHIYTMAKKVSAYNIQLFKTQTSAYVQITPFSVWKPIIQEMILRLYQSVKVDVVETAPVANNRMRRISLAAGVAAANKELRMAIANLFVLLPEWSEYKALISRITQVEEDAEAVAALKLDDVETNAKLMSMAMAIVQIYPVKTGRLALVVINNICRWDSHSQALLTRLHEKNTGLVVLLTSQEHSLWLDEARFLEISVHLLDKKAVGAIVRDVLATQTTSAGYNNTTPETNEEIVDRIFEVSKGNPTYIYEIAKSIAEQHVQATKNGAAHDRTISVESVIHDIGILLHSNRINEMICRRFDRLNSQTQTVLKIAAAASHNTHSFTMELLQFVMMEDTETADTTTVAESRNSMVHVLYDILQKSEFLVIRHENQNDGDEFEEFVLHEEDIAAGKYEFHFDVAIEASTVYGLLLEDYKQVIHESIAEFYRSCRTPSVLPGSKSRSTSSEVLNNRRKSRTSTKVAPIEWSEEAYHWHQAGQLQEAMRCYFYAAEMADNYQLKTIHWTQANVMIIQMKINITKTLNYEPPEASLVGLQAAFGSTVTKVNMEGSPWHMSLAEVYNMFKGDSDLLHIGMLVQIKAIQQRVHSFASPVATQQDLETAIEILALTKTPTMLSASLVSGIMNHPRVEEVDRRPGSVDEDAYFYLPEDSAISLPLIASFLENYLLMGHEMDTTETSPLVECLLSLSLQISDKVEDVAVKAVHRIHSLILNIINVCRIRVTFDECFQELYGLYNSSDHSALLISIYGADLMPLALALVSQQHLFAGDWKKGTECVNAAILAVRNLDHLPSATLAIFPICSALALTHRFDTALTALTNYSAMLHKTSVDAVLEGVTHVTLEWLSRLRRVDRTFTGSWDALDVSSKRSHTAGDDLEVDQILLQSDDPTDIMEEQFTIYEYLRRHARSVEGMFAEMCAIKLANKEGGFLLAGATNPYLAAMLMNVGKSLCAVKSTVTFGAVSSVLTVLFILEQSSGGSGSEKVSPSIRASLNRGPEDPEVQVMLAVSDRLSSCEGDTKKHFVETLEVMKKCMNSEQPLVLS